MDTRITPPPPSNDATPTTPEAPVSSSDRPFSSFTDYERDAEIIALMHGPLPKGNDEKKGGTKRQSSKTVNQGRHC
jgi:hypothetical protein